ncbi:MAG: hypothetical protein IPJ55_07575 [Chloracidobacterium sp.]|nr:hypothetical protein [Chloracidobacterium sp.]
MPWLADSFEKAGDRTSAESTLTESLRIFPRSVLLRIKYAIFLGSGGRETEAISQHNIAANIDRKQALGWEYLLKSGSVNAFLAARNNSEIALPADLLPEAAVRHYLDDAPPNSR